LDEIDYDDYYDTLKLQEDQLDGPRELQPANRMYKDTSKKEKGTGVYKRNENE
jgi:hypothetical protein